MVAALPSDGFSVAPGKMSGHRKLVLDPHRVFYTKRLNQTPHCRI